MPNPATIQLTENGKTRVFVETPNTPTIPDVPTVPATPVFAPTWSTIPATARTIYCSKSGNDANDGLSDQRPIKSYVKAVDAAKSNDHVLLKSGDVWEGENYATLKRSGMLVGSYGQGPRPKIVGKSGAFLMSGTGSIGNVSIIGIEIRGEGADESSWGIKAKKQVNGLLVEDCFLTGYGQLLQIMGQTDTEQIDATIRANVLCDVLTGARTQCLYASHYAKLLIEWNVMDHNGGSSNMAHNMYLQYKASDDVLIQKNIIARGPGNGLQARSGGNVLDNLLLDNGVHIAVAGAGGIIARNVCLGSHNPGWGIEMAGLKHETTDNIVADKPLDVKSDEGEWAFTVKPETTCESVTMKRNRVRNWEGARLKMQNTDKIGIKEIEQPTEFTGSLPVINVNDILKECRMQSRSNWRSEFTAAAFLQGVKQ